MNQDEFLVKKNNDVIGVALLMLAIFSYVMS